MAAYVSFFLMFVCFCLVIIFCSISLARLYFNDKSKRVPVIAMAIIVVIGPKILYDWVSDGDLKLKSNISICAFDNEESAYLYSNPTDDGVTYYYCYLDNSNNKVIAKIELNSKAEIIYGDKPQINLKLSTSDLFRFRNNLDVVSVQFTISPNSLIEIESNSEIEKLLSEIANPYKIEILSLAQ